MWTTSIQSTKFCFIGDEGHSERMSLNSVKGFLIPIKYSSIKGARSAVAMAGAIHAQQGFGTLLNPYLERALLHHLSQPEGAGPIQYADFGCGSGTNTLNYAMFAIEVLKMKPEFHGKEIVCHFADLPLNDFNALFNLFPPVVGQGVADGDAEERTWFASGVPGSQYGRMFPRSSLNIVISTLSLHFLPEIPESVLDKSSPAYNKGRICVHGASPAVGQAFAAASRRCLRRFFECRAEEIAQGGVLALYVPSREDHAHPEIQYSEDTVSFIPPIERAWTELVNEGIIPEELLDSFNLASYNPSVEEIQEAVQRPTSAFYFHKLEYFPDFNPFPSNACQTMFRDVDTFANLFTGMIRSALGSKITSHLGPDHTDALFARMRENYVQDYPNLKARNFFMPLRICLAILVRK